jgi:hypothetical protein
MRGDPGNPAPTLRAEGATIMRRRHPLLFWLGAFWFLRYLMRHAHHARHGLAGHRHFRRHDFDYI